MRFLPRLLVVTAVAGLLSVVATPDARALVRDLGAQTQSERDAAARALLDLGPGAESALAEGVHADAAEVRRRSRVLLATLRDPGDRESRLEEARAAVRAARLRTGGLDADGPHDRRLHDLGAAGSAAVTEAAERIAARRLLPGENGAALGRHATPESLSTLARLLAEDRVVVSGVLRAAREAERRPDPVLSSEAIRDLESVLSDTRRPGRRGAAALLLATTAGDAGSDVAARLAHDAEPGVRVEAARALARHGIAAARPLEALADDPDDTVREAALAALLRIPGRPRPDAALRNIDHTNPAVRAAAAALLRREALPEHVPTLRALQSDPSPRVRAGLIGFDATSSSR